MIPYLWFESRLLNVNFPELGLYRQQHLGLPQLGLEVEEPEVKSQEDLDLASISLKQLHSSTNIPKIIKTF